MSRRNKSRLEDIKLFWKIFGPSPGLIIAFVIFELIFWTSPEWAMQIGFPTTQSSHLKELARCEQLLDREVVERTLIIHDRSPIHATELTDWTPQRVEAVYDSGLTVVSTLGPHGNIQTLVHDLDLPTGTTFRVMNGSIINVS